MKISKISLQIGKKKKIELSLDEARELQQIFADLLGVKNEGDRITIIPSPPVVTVPYPVPVPVPVPRPRRYDWWEVKPIWVGSSPNIGTIGTNETADTITISSVGSGHCAISE